MTPPRVLAIIAKATGSEYWRVYAPFSALQRQGYPCAWVEAQAPEFGARVAAADLVLMCRVGVTVEEAPTATDWVNLLHRNGKRVIYEADDDILTEFVHPQHALLDATKTPAQLEAERLAYVRCLQLCDGALVTTPRLATVVRQYTDAPVRIVPNAIDWAPWQAMCQQYLRPTPGLTIGWIGGKRSETDLLPLAEAWRQIAQTHPDVTFIIVGYHAPSLIAAVPPERCILIDWQPLGQYARAYAGIDIHCCPLASKPFNRTKTAIKAYEAAAAGGVVVYSPTVYGKELRDGLDGLQAETAAEWTAALARLINDAALRQRLARTWAKRVQQQHSLATNLFRWPDAWERLMQAPLRRHLLVPA